MNICIWRLVPLKLLFPKAYLSACSLKDCICVCLLLNCIFKFDNYSFSILNDFILFLRKCLNTDNAEFCFVLFCVPASLFVQSALISKPRLNNLINNSTFSLGQSVSASVFPIGSD